MIPGVCVSGSMFQFPLRAWRNLHVYNRPLWLVRGYFNEKRLSLISSHEDTMNA